MYLMYKLTVMVLCVQASSYDYGDYEDIVFHNPGPPSARDLPPGTLSDIDAKDVYAQTKSGKILGRRRLDEIDMGRYYNIIIEKDFSSYLIY